MTDTGLHQACIRAVFWIAGTLCAIVLAYTTRYFINGDAMAYIEMAEALRGGRWEGLANLTYSPGYPVLLAAAQWLLGTDPMNELQLLKVVNVLCLLAAMAACEFFMRGVRQCLAAEDNLREEPLPMALVDALAYSMFLVASLVMVRVRLLNPDMLILGIVILCAGIVLRIRSNPERYAWYALLGVVTGIGYLMKSFFFTFAPVFFIMAGLCATSVKRAVPRVLTAAAVMLLVASPLIAVLSAKAGHLTYGELGKLAYAQFVSGEGEPFRPQRVHDDPAVFLYRSSTSETRPSGHDIAYWQEGFRPRVNLRAHARLISANVSEFAGQTSWTLFVLVWFAFMASAGAFRVGRVHPPSPFFLLMPPAIAGIGFYLLIHVETRYAGSFFFIAFMALVSSLRIQLNPAGSHRVPLTIGWALVWFFCCQVLYSGIDQSLRGLRSTDGKLSQRDAFLEQVVVKDRLASMGVVPGDEVAVIGAPPVNWARMARVKVTAEAPDTERVLASSSEARAAALAALRKAGMKAVLAKGPAFGALTSEGWRLVEGTKDYYVIYLAVRDATASSMSYVLNGGGGTDEGGNHEGHRTTEGRTCGHRPDAAYRGKDL